MNAAQTILSKIQREMNAPKGQYNNFGKYHYRSCEDILEAVKPFLTECTLTISDEMVMLGDRFYVKATARLSAGDEEISATGYAREAEDRKGMDSAQLTGATSSYARKYALNGLLAIDDAKDADATNDHGKGPKTKPNNNPSKTAGSQQSNSPKPWQRLDQCHDKLKAASEGRLSPTDVLAYVQSLAPTVKSLLDLNPKKWGGLIAKIADGSIDAWIKEKKK